MACLIHNAAGKEWKKTQLIKDAFVNVYLFISIRVTFTQPHLWENVCLPKTDLQTNSWKKMSHLNLELPRLALVFSRYFSFHLHKSSGYGFTEAASAGKPKPWRGTCPESDTQVPRGQGKRSLCNQEGSLVSTWTGFFWIRLKYCHHSACVELTSDRFC